MTTTRAAANAANAQFSTGPRTDAGKVRSSRNSVRHGITSAQNFIAPGEEEEFANMRDALLQQLAPADGVEMGQFDIILHASWGLRRCRLVEASVLRNDAEAFLDETYCRALDRLYRYASLHQRMYQTALKTLQMFQATRLAVSPAEAPLDPEPASAPVAQITKRTQPVVAAAPKTPSPQLVPPAKTT